MLAISGIIQAQDHSNDEIEYEVLYTFSGELGDRLDSLFSITVVIDENEVIKLERIYIKLGTQTGWSDLFAIAIEDDILNKEAYDITNDKEKLLSKTDSVIQIDLGIYPRADYYLEVNTKDAEGNYIQSNRKEEAK